MEENKKEGKKVKRRKVRFKGLLIFILVFYLLGSFALYIYRKPIKNVEIDGNFYLKDNYLISYLDIQDKSVFKVSSKKLKNKLIELDLVKNAIVKNNYFGTLKITIEEEKVLFYNRNNKKVILSSGKEVDYNENYLGIPILINIVPDKIYDELIHKLSSIDNNVLKLISEIEYNQLKVNDKVVDDKRFLFRMNDGNQVFINTINIEKLNNYLEIYEVIINKKGNVKGCLYLDSNSDNNYFNNCENNEVVKVDPES